MKGWRIVGKDQLNVSLNSADGRSEFLLTVENKNTGASDAALSHPQHRILLTEDNELLSVLFGVALKNGGYDVVRAKSGQAALAEMARTGARIDAVVTDIDLGDGHDGWTVAWRARALRPNCPVLYMTAGAAYDWPQRRVPNSALLIKPFDVTEMTEVLASLIAAADEAPD